MPVMDGYDATRELRRDPRWSALPVIAMTANAMAGDRERVLAAGMNDHIAKPVKVDELYATLARWLPVPPGPLELPGVERAAAIGALQGNEALYRRLLGLFADHEASFVERWRAARAAGDVAAATRVAHDLKSAAGTLGARELADAAAVLERVCAAGAPDVEVAPLVEHVTARLVPLLGALRPVA